MASAGSSDNVEMQQSEDHFVEYVASHNFYRVSTVHDNLEYLDNEHGRTERAGSALSPVTARVSGAVTSACEQNSTTPDLGDQSANLNPSTQRLQVPDFQTCSIDDPGFSFMPNHQAPVRQPVMRSIPRQSIWVGHEVRDEEGNLRNNTDEQGDMAHPQIIDGVHMVGPLEGDVPEQHEGSPPQHEAPDYKSIPSNALQASSEAVIPAQHRSATSSLDHDLHTNDSDQYINHDDGVDVPMSDEPEGHPVAPGTPDYDPADVQVDHDILRDSGSASEVTTSPSAVKEANPSSDARSQTCTSNGSRHDSRVTKVTRRRTRQTSIRGTSPHARDDQARTMQQPSEEDLLFLLMARARENIKTRKRLVAFENENTILRQNNMQTNAELHQVVSERDECFQEYNLLSQNLSQFKEKYQKLKKWALETNKDCGDLQEQALNFRTALAGLSQDRTQLLEQAEIAKSTSDSARQHIDTMREYISEAKNMFEEHTSASKHLTSKILETSDAERKADQRCKKVDLHIAHLEKQRDIQNGRLNQQQQELNQALNDMFSMLGKLQSSSIQAIAEKGHISEALEGIRSVVEKDVSTKLDMVLLQEDIGAIKKGVGDAKKAFSQMTKDTLTDLKDDLQKEVSSETTKLHTELRSNHDELIGINEKMSGIQQKAEEAEESAKLFQDSIDAVQEHRSVLETIVANCKKMVDADHAETGRKLDELRSKSALEVNRRFAAQQEAARLNQLRRQLERDLETSRGQTACAIGEQHQLHDKLALLEERLDRAQEIEKQLEVTEGHLRTSIATLEHQTTLMEQLDTEALDRQAELDIKCGEVQELSTELETKCIEVKRLEEQVKAMDGVDEQNILLHDKLERLKAEDHVVMTRLQTQLCQQKVKVIMLVCTLAHCREQTQECEAQKNTLATEVAALPGLRDTLRQKDSQITKHHNTIEELRRQLQEKDKEAKDVAVIQKQKEDLELKVSQIPGLEKELQERYNKIAELRSSEVKAQQEKEEHAKLAAKHDQVTKDLSALEAEAASLPGLRLDLAKETNKVASLETDLAGARARANKVQGLETDNAGLKETLATRKSDIERLSSELRHERAQHNLLAETVNSKDNELGELQQQLASFTGQTEELGKLKTEQQQHEQKIASMQQEILRLEGAVDNARLDQQTTTKPRKAADRSGRPAQFGHSQPDRHQDLPLSLSGNVPASSGGMSIVPETQVEVAETLQDHLIPPSGQHEEDDSSELEMIPSGDDQLLPEDMLQRESNEFPDFDRGQGYVSPMQPPRRISRHREPTEPPPSSPYGSQGEQMLLDQVSQPSQHVNDDDLASNLHPPWDRFATYVASPRRLRSGSQGPPRTSTAVPHLNVQTVRSRASTPAIRREQHQPNSAAKRRVEPEPNDEDIQEKSKKLKRRPANMEVKTSQPRTPKQNPDQTTMQGPGSWRKSSGIIGTNAPAPGQSQRSSKPPRKGSRLDKYATRFAAEA